MEEKIIKKRGRPPKKDVSDSVVSESSNTLLMAEKTKLTIENVKKSLTNLFNSVLDSRQGINDGAIYSGFSPFLQNSRLKTLNSLPNEVTPEELTQALKEPQNNELLLRSSSWSLSATQYLYYKILREAADIPLFKHYVVPPLLTEEGYSKLEFRREEQFVNDWVDKFDLVNTLKRTALEVKREGKATYILRQSITDKDKERIVNYVTWQKLPTEYTKLTAIGERGYIASFNLMIFLKPGFSPAQYPDFIQKIWSSLQQNKVVRVEKGETIVDFNLLRKFTYMDDNRQYKKGEIEFRNKTYMYWVQLPQELCYTFCSDSSHPWVAPDTMGLFTALQELTDYSTLAGLVASTPLTAVITGQAETCPNSSPGQDQTILSPHTMMAFQNAFNGMSSGNVQAFFAPFKDLKLQSLPNIPNATDIKTKAVQNFVSTAGEGGIIAATDKPSVAMIKGAQYLTASAYDFVTRQFESVINFILQNLTGTKYKWTIKIWGDIFTFESKVKTIKELVMGGATFLLPKLASAFDLNMSQVKAIGTYVKANKLYDYFKTLGSTASETTEGQVVGRPSLEDTEVENDNTAISKEAGNNVSETKDFAVQGVCVFCGAEVEDDQYICEDCQRELLNN